MKLLLSPLALLIAAAVVGPSLSAQQVEVRELPLSSASVWTDSVTMVDQFEMRVTEALPGDWIVPVVTVSITGDVESQAETIALYKKVFPELDPEAQGGQAMLDHLGAQVLLPGSSVVAPPVGFPAWNVPCDLGLVTVGFGEATGSATSVRGHGQAILDGTTELAWQSAEYETWETSTSGAFWLSAHQVGASNETINAYQLASAAMLKQFAVHNSSMASVDYVNSVMDALIKVELSLRLDITMMIITDGAYAPGTGGSVGPVGTRALPSLPSGPRPRVVLPNPVTVTFLPTAPVGPAGFQVIEFPAPLPTVYPYFVGNSIEVALVAPSAEPLIALFQIMPEASWHTTPVTYMATNRVSLTLPPDFGGGAVYFFTEAEVQVIPYEYSFGTGIFALPFLPDPE